jgi:myo-inositol-1(or 4)-monophosphatase
MSGTPGLLPDPAVLARLPAELAAFPVFVEEFVAVFQTREVGQPHVARLPTLDRIIELELIDRIQRLFPGAGILAEEHFHDHGSEIAGRGRVRAVLDPIDGTASFLRGEASFTGSVAFELDGRVLTGVVHHPLSGRTWVAARGEGAFVDGRPMPRPPRVASRTVAVSARLMADPAIAEVCRLLGEHGYRVESLGSVALRLCQTAAGDRAGTIKRVGRTGAVLRSWGTAAGLLVCEEAGVEVRRMGELVVAAEAGVHELARALA